MSPKYGVRFTPNARTDLERLAQHLVDAAQWVEDLDDAATTIAALKATIIDRLSDMPWAFRKAGSGSRSTRRELVIDLGTTGYVALYEIESAAQVVVLGIRHQREEDYH